MKLYCPITSILLAMAPGASAQSPFTAVLTIGSASFNFNPEATDSHTVQGSFSGLSFQNAQSVTFSIGQFSGTLPIAGFVQPPGFSVLQYQDSTGQTPYWLSSPTVDPDAPKTRRDSSGCLRSVCNSIEGRIPARSPATIRARSAPTYTLGSWR